MQLRGLARESAFARLERRQRKRGRYGPSGLRLDGIRVVFLAEYHERCQRHRQRDSELHHHREHDHQPAKCHADGRWSDHHGDARCGALYVHGAASELSDCPKWRQRRHYRHDYGWLHLDGVRVIFVAEYHERSQ